MRLIYDLDTADRTRIGLVVLQADETIERDMRRLLPREAELLVSRVPSGDHLTTETLREMERHLTAAASLLPRGARFATVGYGCTSGTAEIGADRIAERVRAGVETSTVTEPVSALIAACAHLGVARLALVSPYVESVSARLRAVLADAGIDTPNLVSFEEPVEANVARIAPASVEAAAVAAAETGGCDAVFLSCTNLRTLGAIEALETRLGMPVLSSNQVLGWHLCRLAGVAPAGDARWRLFR
ncbi:MAG: Asp/Glu racemase [Silicimonas sp.]|jgi:maleate isomerase|nr:Asp/Glu racemase [Silicimonas sp.]